MPGAVLWRVRSVSEVEVEDKEACTTESKPVN